MTQPKLQGLTGLIYTRKSTVSDGRSTTDQETECRRWCDGEQVPVEDAICDEGKSASRYARKGRDGWTELKDRLRKGHVLVAWEASRAYRDVEEFVVLRNLCAERGVPFAYNGRVLDFSSGDDRFMGGLDALMAERESEQLRERFMRGKSGAVERGTPQAALGWGWRPVPKELGEKRTTWETDPDEAPRIQEAVRRKIAGESLLSIHKWLQATGTCVAPATHSSLRRSLLRPTLAGFRTHRGAVVETGRDDGKGDWQAIITPEDHEKLKASFKWDHPAPGPAPKHLLSGIVACGECGKVMRYHLSHGYHVYRCPKGCVSRGKEMLERGVEKHVMRRLKNINPDDYASGNPEVAAAEKRIRELEADLAEWHEKAIAEDVSAEVYASVEKDRKRKIAELRPRTAPRNDRMLTHATWHQGTIHEQRETIRELMSISVPNVFKALGRRAKEDDIIVTLI